jgi:hypothetical protein
MKPWRVIFICCNYEERITFYDSWIAANAARNAWDASAGFMHHHVAIVELNGTR